MDSTRTKSTNGTLTLTNVKSDKTLYKNANNMAYGETFLLCIPKEVAEKMDAANSKLQTVITASMNVDRYDVFVASTNASGVQPVIMVEPAVKSSTAKLTFTAQEVPKGTTRLRIVKTDEAGAGLEGCTFELTYPGLSKPLTGTSSASGEIIFVDLPLNTNVTLKETSAPEGYTLLPAKTINTGSEGGKTLELQLANSTDHTFKIHKISSADGCNLMGAVLRSKALTTIIGIPIQQMLWVRSSFRVVICRKALLNVMRCPHRRGTLPMAAIFKPSNGTTPKISN